MTPDFTAEANKATGSPLYHNSPAEMLARRMFAMGMTHAMDMKYADNATELAIRTAAEIIENGGDLDP